MKELGWISLHRQLKGHWIWEDPIKLKWWIDILISVNTSPVKMNIGNELIECKRGQSIKSLQTWAAEWRTSKDRVRNFFKLLEKDGMVTLENIKVSTRLTVCKYESYQGKPNGKQTPDKREPNADQTPTHPNNNEDNDNKKLSFCQMFDKCRKVYPGTKRGLDTEFADFEKKFKEEFNREFFLKIYAGINAKKETNKTLTAAGSFVPEWPMFKTYLNQRRWEEETPEKEKVVPFKEPTAFKTMQDYHDYWGNGTAKPITNPLPA